MAGAVAKLRKKLGRQRFQRRRGGFMPFNDASTVKDVYIDPKLRQVSAQRVKTHGSVDRTQIPKDYVGYVSYRAHAKTLGLPPAWSESVPDDWRWLYTMFGATKFISDERKAALQLRNLLPEKTKSELYFCVLKTSIQEVRVYFSEHKTTWWIMHIVGNTVKTSITYGTKQRALSVYTEGSVRWRSVETFEFSSPP